ncbi:MAG TPA: diacylglycerol kinase family protein [Candidatus Paceibacterota bacterium]|nr:diacylglycerol kinase family protein [Candidatus Paceibacterota bacterium]
MSPYSKSLFHSFKDAFRGIRIALKERNFKIMLGITALVIATGIFVRLTPTHWALILMLIGAVLGLEMFNTYIEKVADFLEPSYSLKVRALKDIAAGIVLIFCILSALVGTIIFSSYLVRIFK